MRRGQSGVSEGLPSLVEPYPRRAEQDAAEPRRLRWLAALPGEAAGAPGTDAAAPRRRRPLRRSLPRQSRSPRLLRSAPPAAVAPPAAQPVNGAAPAPLDEPSADLAERRAAPAAPLTKEQLKAIEQAREEERKAAAAAEKERRRAGEARRRAAEGGGEGRGEAPAAETKRAAEQAKKDDEARRRAEKLEKERAERKPPRPRRARSARPTRRAAARRDEQQKREKALSDAAARLKQAQAEYQSQVEKAAGRRRHRQGDEHGHRVVRAAPLSRQVIGESRVPWHSLPHPSSATTKSSNARSHGCCGQAGFRSSSSKGAQERRPTCSSSTSAPTRRRAWRPSSALRAGHGAVAIFAIAAAADPDLILSGDARRRQRVLRLDARGQTQAVAGDGGVLPRRGSPDGARAATRRPPAASSRASRTSSSAPRAAPARPPWR